MVSKSRPRDRPLSRRDKAHGKTRPVAPTKNKKEIRNKKKRKEKKRWWRQASGHGRHQQRKFIETTADGNNKMSRETGRTDNAVDASPAVIVSTNDRHEIWRGVYKKSPGSSEKENTLDASSMIYTGSLDSLYTF